MKELDTYMGCGRRWRGGYGVDMQSASVKKLIAVTERASYGLWRSNTGDGGVDMACEDWMRTLKGLDTGCGSLLYG